MWMPNINLREGLENVIFIRVTKSSVRAHKSRYRRKRVRRS